jgi:hypothetical protein
LRNASDTAAECNLFIYVRGARVGAVILGKSCFVIAPVMNCTADEAFVIILVCSAQKTHFAPLLP